MQQAVRKNMSGGFPPDIDVVKRMGEDVHPFLFKE